MFDRTRYIGNICVRIQWELLFFQTSTLKHISVLGLLGTFNVILFLQKSLLSLLIYVSLRFFSINSHWFEKQWTRMGLLGLFCYSHIKKYSACKNTGPKPPEWKPCRESSFTFLLSSASISWKLCKGNFYSYLTQFFALSVTLFSAFF